MGIGRLGRAVWGTVALTVGLGLGGALSAQAAETVVLEFGLFSRSVPVSALEEFAQGNEANRDLAPLLRRLTPAQRQGFREGLTASREVDLVPLSQWFNDPMGEQSLTILGEVIRTQGRLNGDRALRAAVVLSAAEDGSLSLMGVIRHFPTGTLRLDLAQLLYNAQQTIAETTLTRTVLEAVRSESQRDAAQQPIDLSRLPDLTQPGPHGSRQRSLQLTDPARNRTIPVEVVVPEDLATLPGPIPVVVISHGLGDSPSSFLDIAAHAASHGIVAVLPEHIGSNFTQQQAMLSGMARENFLPQEFLDRPLDVRFVLDELSRRNADAFGGRLNLDSVVVAGHSFGGYTALALGGATIDFDRLAQRCDPNTNTGADAALLLECRALTLQTQPAVVEQLGQTGVADERVALVMAFAPVSNLFGPRGMAKVHRPVMILGGALDILAPVVPQQVSAFSWRSSSDRYLYLADNTSHSPAFTRSISQLLNFDDDLGKSLEEALGLSRGVNKALIVAFTQVYGAHREEFRPFLTASYAETVSADPFRFHQVRFLPDDITQLLAP
ncbi:MAG: alpha/beta fold hydrolase [Leptolyngbya sp.]|nr:alpha/beta fold hydrolase [Leptolyngbya sp.]